MDGSAEWRNASVISDLSDDAERIAYENYQDKSGHWIYKAPHYYDLTTVAEWGSEQAQAHAQFFFDNADSSLSRPLFSRPVSPLYDPARDDKDAEVTVEVVQSVTITKSEESIATTPDNALDTEDEDEAPMEEQPIILNEFVEGAGGSEVCTSQTTDYRTIPADSVSKALLPAEGKGEATFLDTVVPAQTDMVPEEKQENFHDNSIGHDDSGEYSTIPPTRVSGVRSVLGHVKKVAVGQALRVRTQPRTGPLPEAATRTRGEDSMPETKNYTNGQEVLKSESVSEKTEAKQIPCEQRATQSPAVAQSINLRALEDNDEVGNDTAELRRILIAHNRRVHQQTATPSDADDNVHSGNKNAGKYQTSSLAKSSIPPEPPAPPPPPPQPPLYTKARLNVPTTARKTRANAKTRKTTPRPTTNAVSPSRKARVLSKGSTMASDSKRVAPSVKVRRPLSTITNSKLNENQNQKPSPAAKKAPPRAPPPPAKSRALPDDPKVNHGPPSRAQRGTLRQTKTVSSPVQRVTVTTQATHFTAAPPAPPPMAPKPMHRDPRHAQAKNTAVMSPNGKIGGRSIVNRAASSVNSGRRTRGNSSATGSTIVRSRDSSQVRSARGFVRLR
eukprot:Clim_evm9s39 gene=Clim_evmTU9s39